MISTRTGASYIRETVFYVDDAPKAKMVKTVRVGVFDGEGENSTELELYRYSQAHDCWLHMRPFDSEEEVLEYIRMPENLVGKGTFFALIAKGDSMIDAGIHEGDYVIVRQTQTAEIGDIVVALYDNLSNLKELGYDREKEQYFLRSRNPDRKKYADIYVTDLQVQGVAVGVYHKLKT